LGLAVASSVASVGSAPPDEDRLNKSIYKQGALQGNGGPNIPDVLVENVSSDPTPKKDGSYSGRTS